MGVFKSLLNWARSAWGQAAGLPGEAARAVASVWHYVTSVHNLLSWITANPLLRFAERTEQALSVFHLELVAARDVLGRLGAWIWLHVVKPRVDALHREITKLRAWVTVQLAVLDREIIRLYLQSLAYTRAQVGAERTARIAADRLEHAAMIKAVAAALATVQKQAAGGYNTGLHDRLGLLQKLLDDVATRNPEVKQAVTILAKYIIDLEEIDNPAARIAMSRLLAVIIDKAGVDKAAGDLIGRLLGPVSGSPRARGLYDVTLDVSERLNAVEAQWAEFMAKGGPEVEQAGQQWKDITGIVTDAGLLVMFTTAVTDPGGWATAMADTVGAVGNDALGGIVRLINAA